MPSLGNEQAFAVVAWFVVIAACAVAVSVDVRRRCIPNKLTQI